MNEYVSYLIEHLREYGNVLFPANRIKQYGEKEIMDALSERGYPCNIRHFTNAFSCEDSPKRTLKHDAVITLVKENK